MVRKNPSAVSFIVVEGGRGDDPILGKGELRASGSAEPASVSGEVRREIRSLMVSAHDLSKLAPLLRRLCP